MIESDFVEAIIALPDQLFFNINTGIHTYIWVLTNEKPSERIGKIQLIDATSVFKKMRKSLGKKGIIFLLTILRRLLSCMIILKRTNI